MTKKLSKADIAGMKATIEFSPDATMLNVPTWLVRGYLQLAISQTRTDAIGECEQVLSTKMNRTPRLTGDKAGQAQDMLVLDIFNEFEQLKAVGQEKDI